MSGLISAVVSRLRPSGEELRTAVLREMDPAHAGEFEPICLGPLGNVLCLAVVGAAALLTAPWRLLRRASRRHSR
jgi:hypothetical protein